MMKAFKENLTVQKYISKSGQHVEDLLNKSSAGHN